MNPYNPVYCHIQQDMSNAPSIFPPFSPARAPPAHHQVTRTRIHRAHPVQALARAVAAAAVRAAAPPHQTMQKSVRNPSESITRQSQRSNRSVNHRSAESRPIDGNVNTNIILKEF